MWLVGRESEATEPTILRVPVYDLVRFTTISGLAA